MEKDTQYTFLKGDLLLLRKGDRTFHLLVVHVIMEGEFYYCWDTINFVYRLVECCPTLFLFCPQFDPHFESDVDWLNEWFVELCLAKFRSKYDL